jgi:hypothetical protein
MCGTGVPPVVEQHGRDGRATFVEYEPDPDLRDTEQVPLLEPGGIEAFFQREVLPHVPDAWIDHDKTEIGYEISFTRHFYKPTPLRLLEEIKADLEALQAEAEGLLDEIVSPGGGCATARTNRNFRWTCACSSTACRSRRSS